MKIKVITGPALVQRLSSRQLLPLVALVLLLIELPAFGATWHVSNQGQDSADGTAAAPWRTIQRAVDQAQPGDTVLIGPGIYREQVVCRRGGDANVPLTIAAAPGARVVISGADLLTDGWNQVVEQPGVYWRDWDWRFPINGPNDLTHPADQEHELTGRAEQVIHDGRLLRQVLRREELARDTFFVDLDAKRLYVFLRDGGNPASTDLEASVRSQWLSAAPNVSHVRVRGIIFRHAANHAQRGAFATSPGSRGWQIEHCVFERTNGCGASLTGEAHRCEGCTFQDNGQLGLGAYNCHHTVVKQCRFERNNVKGYSTGWEAGATKVTMSRGFAFQQCRVVNNRGPGLWYDIGNEQSEISGCYIADNDEAGIFYEISYGLWAHDNLIVNNANRGSKPRKAWGNGGITLSSSENCVIEHNTLVGNRDGIDFREQNRSTPRIDGGEQRILNKDHLIQNNVIAYSQAYNLGFWIDMTFFGPHPAGHDQRDPISEDPKTLNFTFKNNVLFGHRGQVNYLYGCSWRPRSKTANSADEFTAISGIADSSRVADPRFVDLTAGDFRLLADSPAAQGRAGVRDSTQIPRE